MGCAQEIFVERAFQQLRARHDLVRLEDTPEGLAGETPRPGVLGRECRQIDFPGHGHQSRSADQRAGRGRPALQNEKRDFPFGRSKQPDQMIERIVPLAGIDGAFINAADQLAERLELVSVGIERSRCPPGDDAFETAALRCHLPTHLSPIMPLLANTSKLSLPIWVARETAKSLRVAAAAGALSARIRIDGPDGQRILENRI